VTDVVYAAIGLMLLGPAAFMYWVVRPRLTSDHKVDAAIGAALFLLAAWGCFTVAVAVWLEPQ
jgi:hypothetical protein